ncbi:glutathione S-transferase theta-1-like [Erinaceus europaeus]|uniref:glutathione transferase n=1 Tax=Erinaceus europaeus TaxID=9365 RepID=A0A1S2ZKQ9_ERIEU|nr:glutathione S-transferase theta-1-like [Erinaceus europaeus]
MLVELFLDLYSPPCRAIYIFAKKNGIPFELRPVELARGEHLKPEFLKVNPLKKVPALRDGDFLLAESVAILLYLSRKFQTAAHWYPADLQARARVDEFLAWQHAAIQLPATNVYLCKTLLPYFSGQPVDTVKLERLISRLTATLQHLDQQVLAVRPFMATEQVSLADLMAFTELMQPIAAGCEVFRDWPRLTSWRARVEAVLGPELIQEAHRLVLQPRDPREAQRDPQVAQILVHRLQERLS